MPTFEEKVIKFWVDLENSRNDPNALKKYYDDYAADYDQILSACGYRDTTDFCASLLKQYLGCDGKEVLDVGCGTGTTGASLKNVGFEHIDGVDPSSESLKMSKATGIYRNVTEGKITNTQRLSFAEGTYDGVFCIGCTGAGHLKIEDGLPEFVRVLKKGGIGVYIVSNVVERTAMLKKHLEYIENKTFELVRFEKTFYFTYVRESGEERLTCDAYVIKKI